MVAAVSPPWWSEIDDGGKSLPDPVSLSSISLYGKETLVGLHSNKLESPELKTHIEALTEIRG
ncbi:hypothetical protein RchiOBHm_Chr2g0131431 [Rosa chinensis]|uniref:Uncharacterized protein n=1 Tax=Rosa chinensis TaxID=74649 RepID=A0A2P6RV27_ROSCH|nr:hypothetical protein RchiOBHm_Chr2g0131431 [Rosa chinensis]